MTYDNANDASDELFELDIKLVKKHQSEGAISFSIQFNCRITNVTLFLNMKVSSTARKNINVNL